MDKRMPDTLRIIDQTDHCCSRLEAITALMIDCRPGHSLPSEQISTIGEMIYSEAILLRESLSVLKDL